MTPQELHDEWEKARDKAIRLERIVEVSVQSLAAHQVALESAREQYDLAADIANRAFAEWQTALLNSSRS